MIPGSQPTCRQVARTVQIDAIQNLFALNYRAPILLTREITSHMKANGVQGSVVFTASTRGFRAYPGDAVYGGLKAALIRSAESLALDLSPYGIRVNCVAPGAIQVRHSASHALSYEQLGARIPLSRMGHPCDSGEREENGGGRVTRWHSRYETFGPY